MNAITPHIFEDNLVRSTMKDDEPWFVGKDVCHVLGIAKHHQALDRLDNDERGTYNIGTPGGDQQVIIVSEPGVFRLIFTSRKPEAERFKRWLAHEVLPKLRAEGSYAPPPDYPVGDDLGNPFEITSDAVPVWQTRLQMVREARHLWGHDRAKVIWRKLGLAVPPEQIIGGQDEAKDCLWTILCITVGDQPLYRHLMKAMNGDDAIAKRLRMLGVWAEPDEDGFIIANRHTLIDKAMKDTRWKDALWSFTLRRLPGAMPALPRRYEPASDAPASRGTFLPSRVLDLFADN